MRYDDPNTPLAAVIGIISMVLVVVSILLLEGLYFSMKNGEAERKAAAENEVLLKLETEQGELLDSYGWIDSEAGVVHIPIERAAELVIEANEAVAGE